MRSARRIVDFGFRVLSKAEGLAKYLPRTRARRHDHGLNRLLVDPGTPGMVPGTVPGMRKCGITRHSGCFFNRGRDRKRERSQQIRATLHGPPRLTAAAARLTRSKQSKYQIREHTIILARIWLPRFDIENGNSRRGCCGSNPAYNVNVMFAESVNHEGWPHQCHD